MFSLASILTMATCIFMFGIFFSIVRNVSYLARRVETEVPITVFFEEGTTAKQMSKIGKLIEAREEVDHMEFESAEEAWEKMKEEYFQGSDAAEGFKDDNPLINSSNYRIYVKDITTQNALVSYIESLDHVREVNRAEQAANTLGNINRIVSYISVGIISLLLLIAVFLISNTISVGITVRAEEIGIMKYIGATDSLVRAPFLLEGMILGLVGAAVPLTILYFLYQRAVRAILTRFSVLSSSVEFIPVGTIYQTLIPVGLILGLGIGLLGSFWTTRKHLQV